METRSINSGLFDFISSAPTAFQAVETTARMLDAAGYRRLCESNAWQPEGGRGYYVTRNGSSLIAFRFPRGDFSGFMMSAAHGDSPAFKIKEKAEIFGGNYVRLSTEKYGGMLCSSWMDRPLSVAGRITVDTGSGIEVKNVCLGEPSVIIPNVAIHMNRNANDGASFNAAVDMLPLYSTDIDGATLMERVSAAAGVEEEKIITTDLFVFNPQPGVEWHEMISAPRLDDLQCAYASLTAFIDSGKSGRSGGSVPVFCLFDNEEVGSQTKQGAASTFLCDVLERLSSAAGLDMSEHRRRIANSFLVSCDNAHAVHPNHSELADRNHSVYMNQGIVIKYNANQRYTSDAVSAALFRLICEEADVPFQYYANRADMPGGSTLGNIANTQVSLNTVDIGLAQLAMHSAFETAGAKDTDFLCRALTVFFGKFIVADGEGRYILK